MPLSLTSLAALLIYGLSASAFAQEDQPARSLPYHSAFEVGEGFQTGNLQGQGGWTVERGKAEVAEGEGREGTQGLKIHPSDPAGLVSLGVTLPAGAESAVLYSDVWVRPATDEQAGPEFYGAGESFTGFFRVAAGGELFVFNGDGKGGGEWLGTGAKLPLTENGQAKDWIRLSIRQNFSDSTWDLFINGTIFRANMGFRRDAEGAAPQSTRFTFTGHTAVPLLLDDFSAGAESLLFADADRDGLPDEWEAAQGLTAENGGRDGDPDGDGLTNVEELVLGTKPLTADTDEDGVKDHEEYLAGRDPLLKERRWEHLNLVTPELPDAEFIRHRLVLAVPFVLDGPAAPEDCNAALRALDGYAALRRPESVEGLEQFLTENPRSPFKRWIKTHAALKALERSRFGKALPMLEDLWKELPEANGLTSEGVVRSLAGIGLAKAYHMYGRTEEMGAVLEALDRVELAGGVAERVFRLKAEHWTQKNRPELANRCGFMSLTALAKRINPETGVQFEARLAPAAPPLPPAESLARLYDLAAESGLTVQTAQREAGAAWVFPALVHWKAGHFSVLTGRDKQGRYLMLDPANNTGRTVSAETLEEETSGACLIAANDPPAGWSALERGAAERFTGRSAMISPDDDCNKGCSTSCNGVAEADFNLFRASLVVNDTPLVDTPPRGEGLSVHVAWSQHSTSIAHTLGVYPNLGSGTNWTLGLGGGYVEEDTGMGGSRIVYDGVGNRTTHIWNGGSFNAHLQSHKTLEKIIPGGIFTGFRLKAEDGSYEEYFQAGKEVVDPSDPALIEEKRWFLTKVVDAQGLTVCTLTYEPTGLRRLSTISGPPGAAYLYVSYLSTTDYRIWYITDGRTGTSRYCWFSYDGLNRLQTIYDVEGIASTFGYSGSFVSSLTTPYGTSVFNSVTWSPTGDFGRYLDLTDARGWKQRVLFGQYMSAGFAGDFNLVDEIPDTVPLAATAIGTNSGSSYHWDKKMMQDYPPGNPAVSDFTNFDKARHTHWMQTSGGVVGSVPASERNPADPLMGPWDGGYRTFYTYENQTVAGVLDSTNPSSRVAQKVRKVYAWNGASMTTQDQIHSYTWNAQGNLLDYTDPAGRVTRNEYDITGMDLRYVKQKEGASWKVLEERIYGGVNPSPRQPTTVKSASSDATIIEYNAFGQQALVTNPKGEKTRHNYDVNGWLTSIEKTSPVNPALWVTVYTVNARDAYRRVTQETNADGYVTNYLFDVLNRTLQKWYQDGTFENYFYTDNAVPTKKLIELTRVQDRGGNITKYNYNANRGLSSKVNALNQTITYEYCRCAGLASLTDERGKVTRWHRDLNGRVTSKEYKDGKFIYYSYEPESGLPSTLDYPKDTGITLTQTYHKDGNLRKIDYADAGTPDVTYTFDASYNRMTQHQDGAGTWTYGYGLTSTAPAHPGTSNSAGKLSTVNGPWAEDTMTYTYDDAGRVISRSMSVPTHPDLAWSESLTFDSLGRLKTTSNVLGTWTHTYMGNSDLIDKITTTSGSAQEVDYDYFPAASGRFLKQIVNRRTAGGTVISQHDYTYGTGTEFGQIKTWQKTLPSNSSLTAWSASTQTFTYDPKGQLNSVAQSGFPTSTYDYDLSGNREEKSENGVATFYGLANDVNQILSATGGDAATSQYDDNGNLTSIIYGDGSRRLLEWDGINRLKRLTIQAGAAEASGDRRVEFTYNAHSQRVSQSYSTRGASVWGAAATYYYRWDGGRIIQERAGATTTSGAVSYFPQGEYLCNFSGSTFDYPYYYTRDHLGSVYEVMSGSGATGTIVGAFNYTSYGERSTRFGGSFSVGYTGHFYFKPSSASHKAAGQLSLTWYRAYDPRMGIWLNRDPIEEEGGVNLYQYVYNAPISKSDPLGLYCCEQAALDYCAVVGGASPALCFEECLQACHAGKPCSLLPAGPPPGITIPRNGWEAAGELIVGVLKGIGGLIGL